MNVLVRKNNQERGPYTEAELRERLKSGVFSGSDPGRVEGETDWKPLSEILLASVLATDSAPKAAPPVSGADLTWLRQPKVIGSAVVLLLLIFGGINWLNQASEKRKADAAAAQEKTMMEQAQKQAEEYSRQEQERAAKARQAQLDQVKEMMAMTEKSQRDYQEKQRRAQAEGEKAERDKAEAEAKQRAEMAKQEVAQRKVADAEANHKAAEAKQKADELAKKRQQLAASIVRTKAKIDEQQMGPTGTAVKYKVSAHASHLATASMKGSRPVIVLDGVAGPTFDQLIWVKGDRFQNLDYAFVGDGSRSLRGTSDERREVMSEQDAPLVFSEDGSRWAYVGRQGNEYVVTLDGKEFARGTFTNDVVRSLCFVPKSRKLCYILYEQSPGGAGEPIVRLVVEGDQNPPTDTSVHELPRNVCFSRDGEHYAYVARINKQLHLVVDGKMDKADSVVRDYPFNSDHPPLFTGDSKHLITVRHRAIPDAHEYGGFRYAPNTIFVDQKPALETPTGLSRTGSRQALESHPAKLQEILVAPAGTNFLAHFGMPNGSQRLYFNDKAVAEADAIGPVAWSEDGKRFAAICQTKNRSMFVVIDGKKEPEYREVRFRPHRKYGGTETYDAFTTDASKCAYLAYTDKTFVVVDDAESDGYQTIDDLCFADVGSHFGFVATTDTGEKLPVVDGNALPPRKQVEDFGFLPNSAHSHFLCNSSADKHWGATVVVDGIEQPAKYGGDFLSSREDSNLPKKQVLVSPDGKHVLYLANLGKIDASGYSVDKTATKAVCLDGKLISCEGEHSEVRAFFTPDSKHVVWIDWGGKLSPIEGGSQYNFADIPGFSIYVDGQFEGHFDSPTVHVPGSTSSTARFFFNSDEGSQMNADGTLTLIAQVGDVIKKLRITPASDATLARFAALSEEGQFSARNKAQQESTPSNW